MLIVGLMMLMVDSMINLFCPWLDKFCCSEAKNSWLWFIIIYFFVQIKMRYCQLNGDKLLEKAERYVS